jgi:hypothetical protein
VPTETPKVCNTDTVDLGNMLTMDRSPLKPAK